jgi:hypothetical protein
MAGVTPRRATLAAIVVLLLGWQSTAAPDQPAQPPTAKGALVIAEPPPVEVFIGPGKDVRITLRSIQRAQMVGILSDFFAKGQELPHAELERIFAEGGDLTFVLTTAKPANEGKR